MKKQTCRNCGGQYPHEDSPCPAKGKPCHFCKKMNHFASVCRAKSKSTTKTVNQVEEKQSCSEEIYLFGVPTDEQVNFVNQKQPKTTVTINGLTVTILADTGSSINVIDEGTFSKFPDNPQLKKSGTKVKVTKLKGKFDATIEIISKISPATVFVVEGNYGKNYVH